ncbi:MAG TPA: DUF2933 domain-containing protein [Burkholderiales bacterium]|nr:DUF2933 domain-containing protein [Burkholderiales bacterium]
MAEHSHENRPSGGGSGRWVFWGFVLIAAFFLVTEHRAHAFQYLPFLLIAACPLLHLFHGHGGHGGHRGQDERPPAETGEKKQAPPAKHGGCH